MRKKKLKICICWNKKGAFFIYKNLNMTRSVGGCWTPILLKSLKTVVTFFYDTQYFFFKYICIEILLIGE